MRGERLRDLVVVTVVADRGAETRAWTTHPAAAEGATGDASGPTEGSGEETNFVQATNHRYAKGETAIINCHVTREPARIDLSNTYRKRVPKWLTS